MTLFPLSKYFKIFLGGGGKGFCSGGIAPTPSHYRPITSFSKLLITWTCCSLFVFSIISSIVLVLTFIGTFYELSLKRKQNRWYKKHQASVISNNNEGDMKIITPLENQNSMEAKLENESATVVPNRFNGGNISKCYSRSYFIEIFSRPITALKISSSF